MSALKLFSEILIRALSLTAPIFILYLMIVSYPHGVVKIDFNGSGELILEIIFTSLLILCLIIYNMKKSYE